MDIIDIREKQLFSNQEIFLISKNVLRSDEYDSFKKLDVFIFLIRYISDEQLLTNTLELLKEITFFKSSFLRLSELDFYLDNQQLTQENDRIKVKASICHITLLCNLQVQTFKIFIKNSEVPELLFKINDKYLEYNLTEITDSIKKASFSSISNNILELSTIREQETEIKKLINSLNEIDYQRETNTFKKEKKYLKIIKENLIEATPEPQPKAPGEVPTNSVPFKVGLLFAQRKIFSKKTTINGITETNYFYENETFVNPNQLSKRLGLSRQYINDSFTDAETKHNIFKSLRYLKSVIDYCTKNEITIDEEFINKYSTLIENKL